MDGTQIGWCVRVLDYQPWLMWILRKYIFSDIQTDLVLAITPLLSSLHRLEGREEARGIPPGMMEPMLSMLFSQWPLWDKDSECRSPGSQRPWQFWKMGQSWVVYSLLSSINLLPGSLSQGVGGCPKHLSLLPLWCESSWRPSGFQPGTQTF